ncbi:MAG TPA: hypothetical protein DHU81_13595, partial [Hyphomonas sp.]|nr:hypothetical protein [Hyphomonas sp.]
TETAQEFLGTRYYLCGFYYQRDGVRLHREVWKHVNKAEIPDGYHVHHKDHDRSNNSPENLELVSPAEHMAHHHKGVSKPLSENALKAAAEWHGSEDGLRWHHQHYENNKHKLHVKIEKACEHCGKAYMGAPGKGSKFCSNACKTRHRFLSGIDNEERTCVACSSAFVANKYVKKATCSKPCATALTLRKRNAA